MIKLRGILPRFFDWLLFSSIFFCSFIIVKLKKMSKLFYAIPVLFGLTLNSVDISASNNKVFITGLSRSANATTIPLNAPLGTSYIQPTSNNNPNFSDAYIAEFRPNAIIGIKENTLINSGSVLIYPNPTNSGITIKLENLGKTKIEIKSVLGQTVYSYSGEITAHEFHIDLSKLTNGIYFVNIYNDNKQYSQKVILSK